MDSEVQENNVHDKLGELFMLLFGDSYRRHQTVCRFQDSILRAMNTVEVNLELQVNKQLFIHSNESELTSHSWMHYIRQQFGTHGIHVTNVQIVDMNDKIAIAMARIVVATSTREETIESINAFYKDVSRRSYDNAFNKDMEKLLDNSKV